MLQAFHVRRSWIYRSAVWCGLLILPCLGGCGRAKKPWETAYPTKGTVTYKGKPVADADVSLFPQDSTFPDSVRPRARSNANGEFEVWTYQRGDGAPAGTYKVLVTHFPIVEEKGIANTRPNDLPAKYSRVDTTDLVVEIGKPVNELSVLELK